MNTANQSGRTMLEMLGVLGIMGIITYGAVAGINYGMSSYKINQTYSEVQDIIQGVEDLYSWSKGYPLKQNELMKAACDNDIFTNNNSYSSGETMVVNGPFGEMWIEAIDAGKNFAVNVKITNSSECERLAQMDWRANNIKCDSGAEDSGEVTCTCNSDAPTTLEFSPL